MFNIILYKKEVNCPQMCIVLINVKQSNTLQKTVNIVSESQSDKI